MIIAAGSANAGVCSAAAPWEQSLNITNPTANGALTPAYFYQNFSNTTGHTQGNFSDFRICNSSGAYVPYAIEYSVNGTFAGIILKPACAPTGTGQYWADYGIAGDSNATALSVLLNGDSANYQVNANNLASLGGTVVSGSGWVGCYGGACDLSGNWTFPMTVTVWAMLQNMSAGGYFGMGSNDGVLGGSASTNFYLGYNNSLGGKYYAMRYDNATTFQLGVEFGRAYNGTLVRYEATFINGSSLSYMNGTTSQQGSVFNVSDNRQPSGNATARMRFQVRSDGSIMSTWRFYSISSRPAFASPINTSLADGLKAQAVASNTLNSPTAETLLNNASIVFNYTPSSFVPRNASLFGNWSAGVWAANASNSSTVVNESANTITVVGIPSGCWLWNIGASNGTQYIFGASNFTFCKYAIAPTVSLNAPVDSALSVNNQSMVFNGTVADNYALTNASLFSNATGVWARNSTNTTLVNGSLASFTVSSFPVAGVVWNIEVCDSLGQCAQAAANRTLFNQLVGNVSTDSSANYTESDTANVSITVTGVFVPTNFSAIFFVYYFNGTTANATVTASVSSASSLLLSATFPIGSADNATTEWRNFSAYLNSSQANVSLAQVSRTAYRIVLTNCSAGSLSATKTLTFFVLDEDTDAALYNSTIEFNANASVYGRSFSRNYNFTFNLTGLNTNNASVCLYPQWQSYFLNGFAVYNASGYTQRTYVAYSNFTNTTQSINLYLLSTALSAQVTLTVQDGVGLPIVGAVVQILRYFVGNNAYKTVAQVITGNAGTAVTYLRVNDVSHKFIVQQGGVVTLQTDRTVITCPANTNCPPYPVTLIVTAGAGNYFNQLGAVSYSCSFNNATLVLTCTFSDASQISTRGELYLDRMGALNYTRVCTNTCSSAACTLICSSGNITNTNFRYQLWLFNAAGQGTLVVQDYLNYQTSPFSWGSAGLLMGLLVVLALFFVGAWNPLVAMLLALAGMVGASFIGLWPVAGSSLIGLAVVIAIYGWKSR